jgi:ABC-2 type transport system ATP-binding protein
MSDVMIDARDLTKLYGTVAALRNASFQVNRGEVVGFLGPNGAGKTTTMKILTCFIAPSGGTAQVGGADIFEDPIAVRELIGYLPESTPLYTEMLVLEYLQFVGKMRGLRGAGLEARLRRVVEETSLGDVIGKSIGELSKGFRQRVGLAQALIHEPPVLILDEPMSGLDPNQASEIRELIREIGRERTIILSTHNLAEVRVTCGRVLIISQGQLVADDTPDELAARAGKPRFIATLKQNGHSASEIREVFLVIGDAQSVKEKTGGAPGELLVEVVPKGNQDLRAEIFQAAVSANLVLLGLEQRGENLEDIFRQLTTGNGGASS